MSCHYCGERVMNIFLWFGLMLRDYGCRFHIDNFLSDLFLDQDL